ncbi:MAG: ASCH domain-containing protein [Candidatus Thorarchaeota archaeon]
MMSRTLLLSVQPRYAERILDGEKTVELRKVRPNVKPGDAVILYVSSPIKEIKAVATVEEVTSAHPNQLWERIADDAGVSSCEFFEYFADKEVGHAIRFGKLRALDRPIALSKLRSCWPNFHPPQVHLYITEEKLKSLLDAIGRGSVKQSLLELFAPQLSASI